MAINFASQVQSASQAKAAKAASKSAIQVKEGGTKASYTAQETGLMNFCIYQQSIGSCWLGVTDKSLATVMALLAIGMGRTLMSVQYKVRENSPTSIGKGKVDFRGSRREFYNLVKVEGSTLASSKKTLEEVSAIVQGWNTVEFQEYYAKVVNKLLSAVKTGNEEELVKALGEENVEALRSIEEDITAQDLIDNWEQLAIFSDEKVQQFYNALPEASEFKYTLAVEAPVVTEEAVEVDEAV